jgi:signal transduction histidine kinase
MKLFTWITALILGFVLFLLLLTTYFLKPFYINSQKKSFIEASILISELFLNERDSFYNEVRRIERLDGYMITFRNQMDEVLYSTLNNIQAVPGGFQAPPRNRPPQDSIFSSVSLADLSRSGYVFQEQHDPQLNATIFNMYTKVSDDIILQMSRPLESIDQSIRIAIRFIAIAGVLSLLAGSVVALIVSGIFTQPIKNLTAIADSMAHLDFSHKYNVSTRDEIGSLGLSINSLSDQLSHSIKDLQKMNKGLLADIEQKVRIDEMRKEFIFSISHELRTPISLIRGYTEGLLDNVADDAESKKFYCDVIVDETMKMEKHVQDLLELSHLESGNFLLDISRFNITAFVEGVLMKYQRLFQEKNITYSFHEKRQFSVLADRERIEQVLVNYINNAVNHIDGKRHIDISIAEIEKGKIRINVSNTGKHIPESSLDKIWHSYYKVDKARTRKYGGYGLGLSIVKAIQDQHGNGFGVENLEDERVLFWFDVTQSVNNYT